MVSLLHSTAISFPQFRRFGLLSCRYSTLKQLCIGVSDTDQMEEKALNSYIYTNHDVYIEESLQEVLSASLR